MISVVTITYNNYEDLVLTTNSLKGIADIEHIIINGGECNITKKFLDSYNGISISEPDEGISDAFNKGIKLASGAGICFLNSGDTCIDKEYYSVANKLLETTETNVVHGNIIYDHETQGKITRTPIKITEDINYYTHPSLIVSKNLMNSIGLFDTKYKMAMDFDFFCRMHNFNLVEHYYNKEVVFMDGTGVSSSNETKALREVISILKKNNLYSAKLKLKYIVMLSKVYIKKLFKF